MDVLKMVGTEHLTDETLRRLAAQELSPADIPQALRHLGECDACRQKVRTDVGREIAAVRAALRKEEEAQPRRARWLLPVAAALFLAALLALFVRRDAGPTSVGPRRPKPAPPTVNTNPEWDRLVRDSLTSGRLPFPADLEALGGDADALRGTNEGSERVWPAGVVIDDTRPRFTWPARSGATCVVTILSGDQIVERSETLPVARWQPHRDLPRGRTYEWQVAVKQGGRTLILPQPSDPVAVFRVVSERDHQDIVEAKRIRPADHILQAVLYARSGLRDEALAALRAASSAEAADARRLLEHESGRR